MIFLALIALVLVLSHVFYLAGSQVSFEQAVVTTDVDSEASLGRSSSRAPNRSRRRSRWLRGRC
ncbi:hypothetical protein [Cellulomonas soli]